MTAGTTSLRYAVRYRQACRIIDAQLGDCGFGVDTLIGSTGLSRATLYRVFREQGLGVRQALRERRLVAARRLLITGTETLTAEAVAYRCGFIDSGSFRRAFRRYFGSTPHDHRCWSALRRESLVQDGPG